MGLLVRYNWKCSGHPKDLSAEIKPCAVANTSYTSSKLRISSVRNVLLAAWSSAAAAGGVLLTWSLTITPTEVVASKGAATASVRILVVGRVLLDVQIEPFDGVWHDFIDPSRPLRLKVCIYTCVYESLLVAYLPPYMDIVWLFSVCACALVTGSGSWFQAELTVLIRVDLSWRHDPRP